MKNILYILIIFIIMGCNRNNDIIVKDGWNNIYTISKIAPMGVEVTSADNNCWICYTHRYTWKEAKITFYPSKALIEQLEKEQKEK